MPIRCGTTIADSPLLNVPIVLAHTLNSLKLTVLERAWSAILAFWIFRLLVKLPYIITVITTMNCRSSIGFTSFPTLVPKKMVVSFIVLLFYFLVALQPTSCLDRLVLWLLDYTQLFTHPSRTPLKEWSALRRGLYLHNGQQTQKTNIHALSGIRTRDLNIRAPVDPLLRPHDQRVWQSLPFTPLVLFSCVILVQQSVTPAQLSSFLKAKWKQTKIKWGKAHIVCILHIYSCQHQFWGDLKLLDIFSTFIRVWECK